MRLAARPVLSRILLELAHGAHEVVEFVVLFGGGIGHGVEIVGWNVFGAGRRRHVLVGGR